MFDFPLLLFQACKDHIDGILYMFSFTDKASFEDIPQQMSRILGPDDSTVCQYVLGTKYPF